MVRNQINRVGGWGREEAAGRQSDSPFASPPPNSTPFHSLEFPNPGAFIIVVSNSFLHVVPVLSFHR